MKNVALILLLSGCTETSLAASADEPASVQQAPLVCDVPATEDGGVTVKLQRGSASQWCWIAVASMVSEVIGEPLSQCELASQMFKKQCCTATGSPIADCNQPGRSLDVLVDVLGLTATMEKRQIDEAELASELTAGSPVGMHLNNAAGAGHTTLITNMVTEEGTTYYTVADPALGSIALTYDQLTTGYNVQGNWTWTYTLHHISRDGKACGL
jgi:hypothetical protein